MWIQLIRDLKYKNHILKITKEKSVWNKIRSGLQFIRMPRINIYHFKDASFITHDYLK